MIPPPLRGVNPETLHARLLKSSGTVISSFDYRYDNMANRRGVTEAGGVRVTWSYDASYQLVNERR
ncbi:MAG: hypothetical protein ACKV0T_25215, partial [Planctomycetales bacterium]